MNDINSYLSVAKGTGVYRDIELDILEGVLEVWDKDHGKGYTMVEVRDGERIAGFGLYSPVPQTEFSFELFWFIADRNLQKSGVGNQLMQLIEQEILKTSDYAILRIETSAKKELSYQQRFYETSGFMLIGRIVDFYETGDDFLMYAKFLSRIPISDSIKSVD